MGKITLIRKIKLFREYLRILKTNDTQLDDQFSARVDRVGRIYKVVNVPPDEIGANFNLKKSDIDRISTGYVTDYKLKLSTYLNKIGLIELYSEYEVRKVGKYNYLVIFGYSLFRSDKLFKTVLYKVLPLILIASGIFFYFFT